MNRGEIWFIALIQLVLTISFIVGFGYFMKPVSEGQALFLTTGTATNTVVMVALVSLPNILTVSKIEGRLDYFLPLPLSREIYPASITTYVAIISLPGTAFAVWFGAWHYDLALIYDPVVFAVVGLGILSLAGVGIAIGVSSPNAQLTNAITNLMVFYV